MRVLSWLGIVVTIIVAVAVSITGNWWLFLIAAPFFFVGWWAYGHIQYDYMRSQGCFKDKDR